MKERPLQIVLLFYLLMPSFSFAQDIGWLEVAYTSNESPPNRNHYSGGIFFSAHEDTTNQLQLYYRGGFSTLVAFDGNPDNDYFGLEATVGLKLGGPVSFLSGIGLMLGQTSKCDLSSNLNNGQCVEDSVTGLIPEIGIRLTFGRGFFITAIARKYILLEGEDDFFGRGISLGFRF